MSQSQESDNAHTEKKAFDENFWGDWSWIAQMEEWNPQIPQEWKDGWKTLKQRTEEIGSEVKDWAAQVQQTALANVNKWISEAENQGSTNNAAKLQITPLNAVKWLVEHPKVTTISTGIGTIVITLREVVQAYYKKQQVNKPNSTNFDPFPNNPIIIGRIEQLKEDMWAPSDFVLMLDDVVVLYGEDEIVEKSNLLKTYSRPNSEPAYKGILEGLGLDERDIYPTHTWINASLFSDSKEDELKSSARGDFIHTSEMFNEIVSKFSNRQNNVEYVLVVDALKRGYDKQYSVTDPHNKKKTISKHLKWGGYLIEKVGIFELKQNGNLEGFAKNFNVDKYQNYDESNVQEDEDRSQEPDWFESKKLESQFIKLVREKFLNQ